MRPGWPPKSGTTRGSFRDLGEDSRERPWAQLVAEPRDERVDGSSPRPTQDLRHVAQGQISGEVLRGCQRRARHFQSFHEVGHAVIVIDQGPRRLSEELGRRAAEFRVERDPRPGDPEAVDLKRLRQDRDPRRRWSIARGRGRRSSRGQKAESETRETRVVAMANSKHGAPSRQSEPNRMRRWTSDIHNLLP